MSNSDLDFYRDKFHAEITVAEKTYSDTEGDLTRAIVAALLYPRPEPTAKELVQNEILALLDPIIDNEMEMMLKDYHVATIAREVLFSTKHYAEALGSILQTINSQKLTVNKLETIAEICANALKWEGL